MNNIKLVNKFKKYMILSALLTPFLANACNLNGSIDSSAEYERNERTIFYMNINAICSENDLDFNLSLITGNSNTATYRYFTNEQGLVAGIIDSNRLKYIVYTDMSNSNIFGDGSNGTKKVAFSASIENQTKIFPLFVPAEQSIRPGSYSDILEFDIEY